MMSRLRNGSILTVEDVIACRNVTARASGLPKGGRRPLPERSRTPVYLLLEVLDRRLQQSDGIRRIVNAPALVLHDELPVVGSFQLRLGPGRIDGQGSLDLRIRRQKRGQLVEQVLHLGLDTVDDAVAVII